MEAIQDAEREMGLPASIRANFAGTAQAFPISLASQPILILGGAGDGLPGAGDAVRELHSSVDDLSTLPSAGVGAILALILFKTDLNVIAMIGIVLLIGIVKKNAIMMIDFALDAERNEGMSPLESIYTACLLRFRPILMTTMAALLGGLPLALGGGTGSN